jgi:hypothetical protein
MDEEIKEESLPSDEDKQTVPVSRFKEVYREKKELEQKVSSLEAKKEETPDEKKELEAKTYLKNLQKEVLKEMEEEKVRASKEELTKFNQQVEDTLVINTDVKKAEFLKFIEEEAEHYGIESVDGAMKLYRKFNDLSKEVADKTKKDISSKPKMPTHEGGGKPAYDDGNKSLYEIANEAKKELK